MITNLQAANLYKYLTSPSANDLMLTMKGNISVQKNISALKSYVDVLAGVEKNQKTPSEAFLEFQGKRTALIKEHAVDDLDELPESSLGNVRIKDVYAFNESLNDLLEEYKSEIEEYESKLKEWEEYLEEEAEVSLVTIDESEVKCESMSKSDFEFFSVMVQFSEE